MDYNEPSNIGSMRGITPSVKYLLILNIAVYLFEGWFQLPLRKIFQLQANWYSDFQFPQLFTYMFVHGSMNHLLMNMLGLFFIGPTVERTLGSYRFFILYYLSGVLGGLGWSLLAQPGESCVGASGAVMGILGAFAALYPNAKLLLYFIIPVRAWVLVAVFGLWELSETIKSTTTADGAVIGGIANAAHLMGGVAGFCYALSLKHPHLVQELKSKLPGLGKSAAKPKRPAASGEKLSKAEIDHILDKIGKEGMGALTHREREMLKRATRG